MHAPQNHAFRPTPATVLALALLGAMAVGAWQAWQMVRMVPGTPVPMEALAAPSAARSSDMRPVGATAPSAGPGWEVLTTPQKLALYPLAERWAVLSELQKRRWLVLAQNFSSLPEPEQQRLHERMAEWTTLSAQQRNQARLNYAVTNTLAPDNKRAQWEAYQALSTEEKNRLAAAAAQRTMGAATALRPVSPRKLVQVPAAAASHNNRANPPKIPASAVVPTHAVPARPPSDSESKAPSHAPTAVETAPVTVPQAVPAPLPPLAPAGTPEPGAPLSADTASQYSH
ncbi:hypothetical protein B2J88_22890 [Rhodococcus sp. SRB_17]|nr:hypothetical protein [Rhodococcus sp. SRB_17]